MHTHTHILYRLMGVKGNVVCKNVCNDMYTFLQNNTEFAVNMLVVGNKFQSFQSTQSSVQVPLRGTYMLEYKNNIVLLKAC